MFKTGTCVQRKVNSVNVRLYVVTTWFELPCCLSVCLLVADSRRAVAETLDLVFGEDSEGGGASVEDREKCEEDVSREWLCRADVIE